MTKNSYARFDDVRAYHDEKTGDIHLTIKDSRFKDGFKLTLNAGRKEEIALREILQAETPGTEIPAQVLPDKALYSYHVPDFHCKPDENEFASYGYTVVSNGLKMLNAGDLIPIGATGFGRFDTQFWSARHSNNLLLAGAKGSGKRTFLHNVIKFCNGSIDNWNITALDGSGYNRWEGMATASYSNLSSIVKALDELVSKHHYIRDSTKDENGTIHYSERSLLVIDSLYRLCPKNPNSWAEVIQYENIKARINQLLDMQGETGLTVINSLDNPMEEGVTLNDTKRYSTRVVLGRVSSDLSKLILKSDIASKPNKIQGRAHMTFAPFGGNYQMPVEERLSFKEPWAVQALASE